MNKWFMMPTVPSSTAHWGLATGLATGLLLNAFTIGYTSVAGFHEPPRYLEIRASVGNTILQVPAIEFVEIGSMAVVGTLIGVSPASPFAVFSESNLS